MQAQLGRHSLLELERAGQILKLCTSQIYIAWFRQRNELGIVPGTAAALLT